MIVYDLLNQSGNQRNIMQFQSSKLDFLEKFSANIFALSNIQDNTSGPLNKGGIAALPLLRTISAICHKSQVPDLWEVIDSFVLLA